MNNKVPQAMPEGLLEYSLDGRYGVYIVESAFI